ncbi:hypothetical protein AQUCO_00700845v1 [Aquilegia coerulea]|uniref:F-box associated beta-propeller type 3 domain-containing protein n=1 Tax=Aquilegia coerulea TaxID=218851 RepID=A0A2G5ELY5_AQUCA|nr:hypothetical protein AQUCO_00700845v1 [Aquilegia coerulea]
MKITKLKCIKIDLRFPPPYRHCMSFLYGSHNGFLLFKNIYCDTVLFIWNPITQEKMTLDTDSLRHSPCAFYFHPKSREHRVLLRYLNRAARVFEFIVVSLETKLSRVITTASFSHPPLLKKNPIILNGALHWPADGVLYKQVNEIQLACSNSIVVFSMDREEVQTISHPGYQCDPSANHSYIQIIDMEGKLCYCDFDLYQCTEISLWILEDYEKQVWVKRHVVNTDPMMNSSILERFGWRKLTVGNVEVVHMYGDELLINLFRRNLFLYNLQLGTFRRVGKKSKSSLVRPVAHINSLVSLRKIDGRHA